MKTAKVWLVVAGVLGLGLVSEASAADRPDWFVAAQAGSVAKLEAMLDQSPTMMQARTRTGRTVLHAAALGRQPAVVDWLVAHGADVNAADRHGETPLHVAVHQLRPAVVERFLAHGADVKAADKRGRTPLHVLADTVLAGGKQAAAPVEIATALLEAGADVNAVDAPGRTPLHVAAARGNRGLVEWFLKVKADVTVADGRGRTALHDAALTGDANLLAALIEHGAEVNATDRQGETPLHAAARRFRLQAVKLLVDEGAKVDAVSAQGRTPLHLLAAQSSDRPEVDRQGVLSAVAEVLLTHGADPSLKDHAGATALDYAVKRGHVKLAETLRSHAA